MAINKLSSAQFNQALNAYNKALNNNKGITRSNATNQPLNVLRTGDTIDVVAKQSTNSFPNIVNGILSQQLNKIQEGEKKTKSSITSEGNLIEIMQAVNSAQTALDIVITVRDKFINAYQEILKMPL